MTFYEVRVNLWYFAALAGARFDYSVFIDFRAREQAIPAVMVVSCLANRGFDRKLIASVVSRKYLERTRRP